MRLQTITASQQSQTLIKMGKGSCMVMIKQKDKTLVPQAGSTAFTIKENRQAATKCLLLQQEHPAQAPVNKDQPKAPLISFNAGAFRGDLRLVF